MKYKQESFPPHHTVAIKRGDVLIDNDEYGQYKGELQIALKPMLNTGKVNVVGKIENHDLQLLDYLKPWAFFKFKLWEIKMKKILLVCSAGMSTSMLVKKCKKLPIKKIKIMKLKH